VETRGAVDDLFQLPLADFTAARNALVTKLKQSGDAEEGNRVKGIAKPPLSAWVVNQLYWRHRKAFDQALDTGERFRKAQAAQLDGKSADLRATLEARREALSTLAVVARDVLRDAGHPATPDLMRRITTTLEALTAYGKNAEGPAAGRLTADVDPPGFEALASLVPRGDGSSHKGSAPTRVIPFSQPERKTSHKKASPEEEEQLRKAQQAEARKSVLEAERVLQSAKRDAEQARVAMKKAAAAAKEKEELKASLEVRLEKASTDLEAARQEARRVASHAEDTAQAMDDAERALAGAREALKNLR